VESRTFDRCYETNRHSSIYPFVQRWRWIWNSDLSFLSPRGCWNEMTTERENIRRLSSAFVRNELGLLKENNLVELGAKAGAS
jgi:hypothetical protein